MPPPSRSSRSTRWVHPLLLFPARLRAGFPAPECPKSARGAKMPLMRGPHPFAFCNYLCHRPAAPPARPPTLFRWVPCARSALTGPHSLAIARDLGAQASTQNSKRVSLRLCPPHATPPLPPAFRDRCVLPAPQCLFIAQDRRPPASATPTIFELASQEWWARSCGDSSRLRLIRQYFWAPRRHNSVPRTKRAFGGLSIMGFSVGE